MVGRPEGRLDPEAGSVQQLAYELRKLRVEAGSPTYREMARLSGCGASTLSQAAGGERLPSLPTLRAYVQVCGGDAGEWERRWHEVAGGEAAGEGPLDADDEVAAPYRGLRRFEAQDRELFFGRDELVARLTQRLREHRLVAVVGASGSGKSSLLRAGLIPALRSAGQDAGSRPAAIRIVTPGPRPAAARAALTEPEREGGEQGGGQRDGGDVVVLIDQFEELFTLGADAAERTAFLDLLLSATGSGSRLRVVIAVRADFFGRCAEHPGLAEALPDAALLVAPMDAAALREAIVKPAAAAGLIVERSLTARIVREAEKEPGSLPLVSHALLETWRRRRGRVLTEEMYEAAGGIHGAIAATAEKLYDGLSPSQAATARRILLRLVTPGDGAQDTRRPTDRAELDAVSPDTPGVLELLVQARLLTSDGDSVDLAHEALIPAWPRYRAWVEEDRERLRLHRRLTEAARIWDTLDRDPGALYRGSRLAAAQDAFGPDRRDGFTGLETAFLDASTAAREQETRTAARTTRRLRTLTVTLSVLLVLALAASLTAWRQSRASEAARRTAVAAQQVTLSRQLAAQATTLMNTDTELGMLLAVQAYRASPTAEAAASLYQAAAVPLRQRLTSGNGPVESLAFSHDSRTLAWGAGDGTVIRADLATGRKAAVPTTMDGSVVLSGPTRVAVAFSRDNRTLVSSGDDAQVRRTDLANGRTRTVIAGRSDDAFIGSELDADGDTMVTYAPDDRNGLTAWNTATGRSRMAVPGWRSLAGVSPDGHIVAASGTLGIGLFDTATGRRLATSPREWGRPVFSKDGRTVALTGPGGEVGIWHWSNGRPVTSVVPAAGKNQAAGSVEALSPDGKVLATGSGAGAVQLWDTATGRSQALLNDYAGKVTALAFSDDGRTLAAGAADGTVRLFGTGGIAPVTLQAPRRGGPLASFVAFIRQGRTVAVGQSDGTVKQWTAGSLRPAASLGTPNGRDSVIQMQAAADGRVLETLSADGRVRLWDTGTGRDRVVDTSVSRTAALSADGRTLAVDVVKDIDRIGTITSVVYLWDTASPHAGATHWRTSGEGRFGFQTAVLSPDGRTLAARYGESHTVGLLSAADGRVLRTFATPGKASDETMLPEFRAGSGTTTAFGPDGTLLAATGNDGAAWLWDTRSGRRRAVLSASTAPASTVAFSPDGRTLAVGDDEGTVRLWDIATARVRSTLNAGPSSVVSMVFSPDGKSLATVVSDGTTLLWDVALPGPAGAVDAVCAAVHRSPTPQENTRFLSGQTLSPACPPGR